MFTELYNTEVRQPLAYHDNASNILQFGRAHGQHGHGLLVFILLKVYAGVRSADMFHTSAVDRLNQPQ